MKEKSLRRTQKLLAKLPTIHLRRMRVARAFRSADSRGFFAFPACRVLFGEPSSRHENDLRSRGQVVSGRDRHARCQLTVTIVDLRVPGSEPFVVLLRRVPGRARASARLDA